MWVRFGSVRHFCTLAALGVFLTLLTLPAYTQQLTGTITGSVTDSSGAILPGMVVKATDTGTGLVRSTQADDAGGSLCQMNTGSILGGSLDALWPRCCQSGSTCVRSACR